MSFDAKTFLSKALGDDFLETLSKTELYKPNANIAIDIDDIRIGLKVVPRVIMSMLIRELPSMQMGQNKSIQLMLGKNALLNVNKHDTDTYSGSIVDDGKLLVNFKFRPLPGVGLVIMSAFELYELEELQKEPSKHFVESAEVNVQKLIDERLALHHMVGQVVEKKLMEREAIQQLFLAKIKENLELAQVASIEAAKHEKLKSDIANVTSILAHDPHTKKDEYQRGMHNGIAIADAAANNKEANFIDPVKKSTKKESPLKGFLDRKISKSKKNEFEFKMVKADEVTCPDCRQELFKNQVYTGCVCMGENMDSKIWIKKSANGVSVRFSKDWSVDNMEVLLDLLRRKNG